MALPIIAASEEREASESGTQHQSTAQPTTPPLPTRVLVRAWGCAHNRSDADTMRGVLAQEGFTLVDDEQDADAADVVVLVSCTVKGPSQDTFLSKLRELRARGIPVVVAGCVPQAEPSRADFDDVTMLGVHELARIGDAIKAAMCGTPVRLLSKKEMPPLTLPVIRSNPLVDIIPISLGCLSACAYCKTKHARGHLRSYPPEAIIARALAAARDGCTQIWLTSEDSGAYGSDIGTTLPALLSELTTTLARDAPHVMVRVGMTNPTYLRDPAVLSGLCDALLSRNMFQFLHIPIQSGSDDILTAMRREYTALEFEQIVTELRRRIPGIGLATDIICGYPTEDDAAWRSTMALVQRHEFPILHSSQFYPRPGTPAARLPRLPGTVVKARSSELARWSATLSPFSSLVGTMQEVWLIEERRADGGEKTILVGHTREYVHVMLPHGAAQDGQDASIDAWLLAAMRAGTPVLVRITECSRNGVRGEPQREL